MGERDEEAEMTRQMMRQSSRWDLQPTQPHAPHPPIHQTHLPMIPSLHPMNPTPPVPTQMIMRTVMTMLVRASTRNMLPFV